MLKSVDDQQDVLAFNRTAVPPRRGHDPDLLLPHCWRLQDCTSCLEAHYHCSWCPISSTCIANPATWPLLTPISNPEICPLGSERWELRGNEFGCAVSTVTFLSVVVTTVSTLALICIGWALVGVCKWSSLKWRGWITSSKKHTKWARKWTANWRHWLFKKTITWWNKNKKIGDEGDC